MSASEVSGLEVIDPLIGLIGPSLFPRTIRASAGGVPVPSDPKDLDAVHNFMKSLESRSPEKCMNEAKRIVDGGADLLESNLSTFAQSVAISAKGKCMPREQRPGLGLARKRVPLALRPIQSQPSVIVESAVDLDSIVDPDEYFDAYERMERAKKEIQKQLGISVDKVDQYRQTNNARPHRKGIIGRKYTLNHSYTSAPVENDDTLFSSQETVDQAMPSARKDNSQEISVHEDRNPDDDLEEVKLTGSMKKTESKVSDILQELLSRNLEDLEGDGALNLLQDRLKIKPLDKNLRMPELPDFGRTNLSTVSERFRKYGRSSLLIDNAIKNLNKKPTMEHEQVVNPVHNPESSPTPPRSPFASISSLKKRLLQTNPLSDPFSLVDTEFLEYPHASAPKPEDQLIGKAVPVNDLGISSELESHVDVGYAEPLDSDMEAREVMRNTDVLPMQSVDENANVENAHADSRPIEEPHNENVLNPSVFEEETRDNTSSIRQTGPEPHPEVLQEVTPPKRKGVSGGKRIKKAYPMRKSHADAVDSSVFEEGTTDDMSSKQQTDLEPQPEVCQEATPPKRKGVAGGKRIRQAHPMTTNLADAGTTFENGVRKSKRIRMRPLAFWKGERFVFGRVDDSVQLLGVKYISPGKDNCNLKKVDERNLKVKPYGSVESSAFKKKLEFKALH